MQLQVTSNNTTISTQVQLNQRLHKASLLYKQLNISLILHSLQLYSIYI